MKKTLGWIILFGLILLSACQTKPEPLTPEERASYAFLAATQLLDPLFVTHETVEANILLPLNFETIPGLEIIWTSSERSIISDYGVFKRPNVDIEITLRATMIYGGFMYNKTYTVTAKALIIDDEEPIEKPVVDYETVRTALAVIGLHTEDKDSNGSYEMTSFFGISGMVVAMNGQNQAVIFSEDAFILVEGLLGVLVLAQDQYYHISGVLVYDNHVPKLIVDPKMSTIEWIDITGFDEPEYIHTNLSDLANTSLDNILMFARAVIIEGYIENYQLSDVDYFYTIDISASYDLDLDGRYVQIESIIYFDPVLGIWIFVEDTFKIKEILAPCPLC